MTQFTSSEEHIHSYTAIQITHDDAQEIIRLLKRINIGLQHLESHFNAGIIWRDTNV